MSNIAHAYAVFSAADDAWQAELVRQFGADACNARYDGRGKGTFCPTLEKLYQCREHARLEWEMLRRQRDHAA